MTSQISINVRWHFWRREVPRNEWLPELARITGFPRSWVSLFLNGDIDDADLKQHEVTMLGKIAGLGTDVYHVWIAGYGPYESDVLKSNLRYLINSPGRGGKKVLAEELGVDPTTLSRWLNWSFVPHASTLRQMVSHFGLASGTD